MGRAEQTDRREPACRLVAFEASDGVELTGLLYQPRSASRKVILFLHGTGGASVFSSRRTNLLAAVLTRIGFAFLPFDNRGAHLVKRLRVGNRTRQVSKNGGMAFERIRDCVPDIAGAVAFARSRGFTDVTLAGHSTGANKVAVYDHYARRNRVARYILLAGGDDTGLMYRDQLGPRRFASALARSRRMIRERRGDELVPASLGAGIMSWRALYDVLNPNGDYNVFPFLEATSGLRLSRRTRFRHLRGIRKPVLYVYGEDDEYWPADSGQCVSELASAIRAQEKAEIAVIGGATHGFSGFEEELALLMAGWIERV